MAPPEAVQPHDSIRPWELSQETGIWLLVLKELTVVRGKQDLETVQVVLSSVVNQEVHSFWLLRK
jgi:hypothetical protein